MGYDKASRHCDVYDWCQVVRVLVLADFSTDAQILDVGAGFGKYRILLPEYPDMDACEAWPAYVEEEGLRGIYRRVYQEDICELVTSPQWPSYDLVILGDVLEHIERERARPLIRRLTETCGEVLAVVPYLYEQGAEHGNPWQRHLQPDLTPELMAAEYPELSLAGSEYRDGKLYRGLYRKKSA